MTIRRMAERCGYCGRFMATTEEGWDIEPRSSHPCTCSGDPS